MKTIRVIGFCLFALSATGLAADDFLDRVDEALTMTAFHDNVRARLSGLIDVEIFRVDQPPLGLIDTNEHFLFNPRLSLFLDAQLGPRVYVFVQSRVDRGFDPIDDSVGIRLDEYALRITPWEDGRFNLQIGKFATVIGNWIQRHHSWENPFITAPLPYENLTPVSDILVPSSAQEFLSGILPSERYEHNPLIWGPSYATGVSVAGRVGKFDYAGEIKNSALASRPESWDSTEIGFDHPVFTGRVGFRPNQAWNLGLSASNGPYFRPEAGPTLSRGRHIGDYRELLVGQDISFAWHRWQLWAEFYEARFEVPRVGDADTFAYYFEGKYKFTPQLFGALRWNQQLFATVPDGEGGSAQWGDDVWQIDTALGYRFTPDTQLKLQYSLQNGNSGSGNLSHTFAAQFTVRF
jgi:hypothetical protein